jgi:hypothetical protein
VTCEQVQKDIQSLSNASLCHSLAATVKQIQDMYLHGMYGIFALHILEDFLLSKIPNLEGLVIPNFKPCLVVKINDIQVPTTKKGLESGFGRVKFENPTPQEFLNPLHLLYWIFYPLQYTIFCHYLFHSP